MEKELFSAQTVPEVILFLKNNGEFFAALKCFKCLGVFLVFFFFFF